MEARRVAPHRLVARAVSRDWGYGRRRHPQRGDFFGLRPRPTVVASGGRARGSVGNLVRGPSWTTTAGTRTQCRGTAQCGFKFVRSRHVTARSAEGSGELVARGGRLLGGAFDAAPEVAAVFAAGPGAGVVVAVEEDASGVGPEAGDVEVREGDHGGVVGELDGEDHGDGDVLAAVLD